MFKKFFRVKSTALILKESAAQECKLKRALGSLDLLLLGIGAIIGAGIFVITGTAAAGHYNAVGQMIRCPAGPAIALSFVLTAIACGFAALCYAEFASMIPIAGSAYTYSYLNLLSILLPG